jgi:hypothetical protein
MLPPLRLMLCLRASALRRPGVAGGRWDGDYVSGIERERGREKGREREREGGRKIVKDRWR